MLRFALIAAASAVASYFPVRFLLSPSAFRADVATADVATYLHDDSLRHAARVKVQEAWVDSVYHTLSEEERVGQLFMIRAHSDKGAEYEAAVATQIERYKVGGVCFFQGTPTRQAELTNRYQAASRVPLLVAIDGEWGLSMRLKGVPAFPHQQLIGAVQDNALVYEFGQMVAAHCRRIGVNVNFAPDIDINNNPANPVIGDRSFGEDKYNVAQKGLLYARGMQEGQVMACGKHFPGHGDTDVDSHLDLPLIPFSVNRLDSLELYPFRELAKGGLMSMMIAHLSIPALDPTPHLPSTLSRPIVTGVLRQKLGFEGLIFTDALEMQGVVKYFPNGTASAKALAAGADVALMPNDLPAAIAAVRAALASGEIDGSEMEAKVKRVLRAKYQLGLTHTPHVETTGIDAYFATNTNGGTASASAILRRKLIQSALTLVRNDQNTVPLTPENVAANGGGGVACLSIGSGGATFQRTLTNYLPRVTKLTSGKDVSPAVVAQLKTKSVVVVSLHDLTKSAKNGFGVSAATLRAVTELAAATKVVLVVFGSPYALRSFDAVPCAVAAYEDNRVAEELAAEGVCGAFSMQGRLSVTASPRAKVGDGLGFEAVPNLLRYGVPEEVGMNSATLDGIDDIASQIVSTGAAPGCQILVSKNGRIVYHRCFGHFTPDPTSNVVDTSDVYDMASCTKVIATTPSLMRLYEEGKFDPAKTMGELLPDDLRGSNKARLRIRDVMAHQAGLTAWIPFYKQTIDANNRPLTSLYSTHPDETTGCTVEVTPNLYLKKTFVDEMWRQLIASPVSENKSYKYSDLGFFLFARAVQRLAGKPLNEYAHEQFYAPLGMGSTTFKPLEHPECCTPDRITPSENDTYWRHAVVQGTVHDMGAAMLGGVSGHAGLFSTAHDVAVYFEMLLNKGSYGGRRYFKESTVELFTRRVAGSSRRALGFDMKDLAAGTKIENVSLLASNECFGHTGFVGQGVWADPAHHLLFVFLSNRTYPSMDNSRLVKEQWRAKVQDVIYRALQ